MTTLYTLSQGSTVFLSSNYPVKALLLVCYETIIIKYINAKSLLKSNFFFNKFKTGLDLVKRIDFGRLIYNGDYNIIF